MELQLLISGIQRFGSKLQKYRNKDDQNVLLSITDIHAFLTLLSQDPWFNENSILPFLELSANNEQISRYKDIIRLIGVTSNLQTANVSFLKQGSIVKEDFKVRLMGTFANGIDFLDYEQQEACLERINSWVDDSTSKKIRHFNLLLNEVYLTSLSSFCFKSNWALPFPVEQTVTAPFKVNNETTIQVEMMRRNGTFYYLNDDHYLKARILKLPFADGNTSVLVFLPNKSEKISEVRQRLQYFDYNQLRQRMCKCEVDLSLPKFKFDEAFKVAQLSKELLLNDLCNANLVGVFENEDLRLQDIEQKLFLDVNEAGAESASCTISTLNKGNDKKVPPEDGLVVYEVNMSTEVANRFATTKVVWRVKNDNPKAAEAKFKVILTETAFISEFIMEIEGKEYKSYVKEKEEAKTIYNEAVAQGRSAGLVEAKTRDSREFTVAVNLEPDSVAVFSLTYEEMLQRIHDQYELVLNVCPGQIVEDLSVEVRINESRPLKFVKTPPLRSGNDKTTSEQEEYLDPASDIKTINSRTAVVKFRPDVSQQRKIGHFLGNDMKDGLVGQFVVQYDVEREPLHGEVLLRDGYFVHFFALNDLDPLPKHVVFVLDTSGSMSGRKIEQLKDAMRNILNDLRTEDMVSIVEFNLDVVVWDIESKNSSVVRSGSIRDFREPFASLQNYIQTSPKRVTDGILTRAKDIVQGLRANGSTFIIGGLETALYLVRRGESVNEDAEHKIQPIIMFLTDGEPNVGLSSTDEIVDIVTQVNAKDQVPIFSLSFGTGADKDFLRKLSLKNSGFSRHIYEAADASVQLQDFYKQISSPLLRDINFKYSSEVEDVTRTSFPIYFRGSEIVVAGRCGIPFPSLVHCYGPCGLMSVPSVVEKPVSSLERLWAYLTVKQLLDDRDTSPHPEELTRRAVTLALRYSFVTDVTSLVVVKPNEVSTLSDRLPMDDDLSLVSRGDAIPTCAMKMRKTTSLFGSAYSFVTQSATSFGSRQHSDIRSLRTVGGSSGGAFTGSSTLFGRNYAPSGTSAPDSGKDGAGSTSKMGDTLRSLLPDWTRNKTKRVEEFVADRPFIIMLQLEKNGTIIILLEGLICRPTY